MKITIETSVELQSPEKPLEKDEIRCQFRAPERVVPTYGEQGAQKLTRSSHFAEVSTIPLDRVRQELTTKNRKINTQKVIDSIHGVAERLLTPEFMDQARQDGMYFSNTPE